MLGQIIKIKKQVASKQMNVTANKFDNWPLSIFSHNTKKLPKKTYLLYILQIGVILQLECVAAFLSLHICTYLFPEKKW